MSPDAELTYTHRLVEAIKFASARKSNLGDIDSEEMRKVIQM